MPPPPANDEELGELVLEGTPLRNPDPEAAVPVAEVQQGPREPTLAIGDCEDMTGPSLDWRDRYPLGASITEPNCRQLVQMYLPSPQAAVVEDPVGQDVFRVPAIYRRSGAYVILVAPAVINNVGLIFRDCPEFDPVPVNATTTAGWLEDGYYARVVTAATWYRPL